MSEKRSFAKEYLSGSGVHTIREQGTVVLGNLPDDPDSIPATPPAGFVWMQGGCWWGQIESYGIADVRISVAGEVLDFVITLEDAISLRSLLDQTIQDMQEAPSTGVERSPSLREEGR
ncbi:hypothetical protein [Paracoccus sp. TOH]|uniref:hypothetical protein n=1 Tax=Paracoccus sp. TOH TaxID=1263728 RepID=UPI0025B1476C|nr:hypothetical protein [Paracoccus sp. TOH]WJS86731.1 hypothetical protein NBE95_19915 [Paracoccus sp. TOH]